MSTRVNSLCRRVRSKQVSSGFSILKNQQGNMTAYVLAILFISSIFVTSLYRSLSSGIDSQKIMNKSDAFDIAANALLDYVIVSVKSQWCIGANWTRTPCTDQTYLTNDKAIRRMLASENSIMAMGDYFIRNVVELKKEPVSNYPACASQLASKPLQSNLALWKDQWLKCIRLPNLGSTGTPGIEMTISDLTALPSNHPLYKLFSNDYFKLGDLGMAKIQVSQVIAGIQTPRNGREVNIDVKVEVYKKSKSTALAGRVVSKIEVMPAELNHFGLVLAGDLYMDGTSKNEKGGYIPISADNASWAGINFDSPVYIDGNIVIPDNSKRDFSSHVRFNSNVYLSTVAASTGTDGAICQGLANGKCDPFVSAIDNKLSDYMNGFAKGVDHMMQDPGVDYIPGPQLNGKGDGDSSKGDGVQVCSDLQKATTDFRFTDKNKMIVLKNPAIPNEYTLMWTDQQSQSFKLKTLNRFSTPHNDIPRGEEAKCYDAVTADERLMRPHIYNNNGGTKIPGRKHKYNRTEPVKLLPAYNLYTLDDTDLTSTAASLNQDLLIKSPISTFDSDPGKNVRNRLKKCPKERTKDQIDAIDDDFKEKAAAVVNTEYGIVLKDTNKVQNTLVNEANALKPEDITYIKPTITNAGNTGVADYIAAIFPLTDVDGTLYTAKALMAVNTKLVFQGIKDGLIQSLLEEYDDTVNGTFANEVKKRLKVIEDAIKSLLGITDIADAEAKVAALKKTLADLYQQLNDLNKQISDLQTQLSSTSPTLTGETCTTTDVTTTDPVTGVSTTSPVTTCTSYTYTNPAYTSLQNQISSLQTQATNLQNNQITPLENKIAKYYYLVARRDAINTLVATMSGIKDDIIDLMGADALGRSFHVEEVKGVNAKLKDGTSKEFYAPNVLKMRINLPKISNQFVLEFKVHVDSFDPSFVYTKKGLGKAQCEALSAEPGVVGIWALNTANNRVCLELRSTRLDKNGAFPNPGYNMFNYEFKKDTNGVTSNISPKIVDLPADYDGYTNGYKAFAEAKHPGFNDFKCRLISTKEFVPDELPATSPDAEQLDLDGDNALSEQSLKSENFASQTNHSWFFTGDDPFMDVAAASYNTSNPALTLDIATNTTGPEFPVKSIMSRCIIRSNVTFVAGFYVCRELLIQGGRNQPLEIGGTFIVGRLSIPDSSIAQYGLYFRSIYHQMSVNKFKDPAVNLLETDADCYTKITQPIWYANLSDQNLTTLDRCTPTTFRDDAQAFTWNLVDPDCGIISKFAETGDPNTAAERMACKDEVKRFFIIEKSRGQQ